MLELQPHHLLKDSFWFMTLLRGQWACDIHEHFSPQLKGQPKAGPQIMPNRLDEKVKWADGMLLYGTGKVKDWASYQQKVVLKNGDVEGGETAMDPEQAESPEESNWTRGGSQLVQEQKDLLRAKSHSRSYTRVRSQEFLLQRFSRADPNPKPQTLDSMWSGLWWLSFVSWPSMLPINPYFWSLLLTTKRTQLHPSNQYFSPWNWKIRDL